jgi:hypothetical protein
MAEFYSTQRAPKAYLLQKLLTYLIDLSQNLNITDL